MNLLSAENITKSYSEKKLLEGLNIGINEGDKIGVIGINGTGKSTLLKILAGIEQPDEGKVIKGNSVRVGYLSQNPYFDSKATVIEQVFSGEASVVKLIKAYQQALLNPDTANDEIIKLSQSMDAMNGWQLENEAKVILTKLGVIDFNAIVGSLSGGQRKRIALASALINPCDLLILDEPTNHLDNESIDWLEQYLNIRKGALIMITHDRYFLDRVVNEIVELDRGSLYTYKGNYTDFLEKKAEREEIEQANEKKRQSLFRKELAWIRRGAKARTTKQKARIDRFEKIKEQAPSYVDDKVEISVASSRLGKKVIELEGVSKSYDGKKIIVDFSYIVLRNDRVGIVGPNGIGKSTLINILAGKITPDRGNIEIGETVKIGLYSQETYHMDEELRVIEYIRQGGEYLSTADGSKISASQMLERFLFEPSQQWTPISKLSGGERRRLYLLRVLMEAPNVLLLDEPTNDLDIHTLAILEDYLEDFGGPVIAISHDRYFLDRISDKIFAFEGDGKIIEYSGNYSDYKERSDAANIDIEEKTKNNSSKKLSLEDRENNDRKKSRTLKFSFKEQKEYQEIDDIIAGLECDLEQKNKEIEDAATDYTLLQDLLSQKEQLEEQLQEKMERWIYLNELAEEIEKQK